MVWGPGQRAAGLIFRLMEGAPYPAILPMRVQKIPFRSCTAESSLLPRALPEDMGVDPGVLQEFVTCAVNDKKENLHSMTVLRHGNVIAEYSFTPYDRGIWHVTHSLCKTITALAVGLAVDDGLLHVDDRVIDIFDDMGTVFGRKRYEKLTVFHLLTMTSGSAFAEPQSVTETDWLEGFLNAPQLFPIGERFHYNSMNTYMLAAAVCAKTGKSLTEYLDERLFGPMGIRRYYWETCPRGIEKGGWGLYLLQEDAAKIGQLILNRGKWNGESLIDVRFIEEMSARHSDPPVEMGKDGYGYQCWLWEREGAIRLSGMFGQNVLVVPDLDMVIATNAGAGQMLRESAFLDLCSAFLQDVALGRTVKFNSYTVNGDPVCNLIQKEKASPGVLRLVSSYRILFGRARVLPVFMQLLGNMYTTGITRIAFFRKGAELYIKIFEGRIQNLLQVGFSCAARGEVIVHGEVHAVSVRGRWRRQRGVSVLRVEIAFLEQANTRFMDFFFEGPGGLRVKLWETPGKEALLDGAMMLLSGQREGRILQNRHFRARLETLTEPELIGFME